MDKKNLIRVWVAITAVIVLLAGVGTALAFGANSAFAIFSGVNMAIILSILSVTLFMAWKNREEKKAGLSVEDERTKYITGRAAYWSFFVGIYFMLALLWFNFIRHNIFDKPELEANPTLIACLLVMTLLFFGLRFYLGRKGG